MKKLVCALGLLGTFGCDDPFVAENIDVFTCSVLPYWMADCASPEVHDKAISVLQNGLVSSHMECDFTAPSTQWGPTRYRVESHALHDGSAVSKVDWLAGSATEFSSRNEAPSTSMIVNDYLCSWVLANGDITLNCDGYGQVYSVDIETNCTGFNLGHFGVD